MGKATILGGGPNGLYSIKIDTGQATKTARLAALATRLAALTPELTRAQGLLSVQQVFEAVAEAAVNTCIDTYVAATRVVPVDVTAVKTALDAYTTAAKKLQAEKATTAQARMPVQLLESEQAQIQKDQAKWSALVLEETAQAWCADLTENATGAVATLEIPGENKLVIIAPQASAPTAADGVLTAREVQSGPQAFWNAAVLPGWQRWMPTYRRGVITAINPTNDTANVTLTPDPSSAQGLPINKVDTLTAVPVSYMTCNARAFDVGDACVVKFTNHDWAQPKVVGFVDHPKSCGGKTLLVVRLKVVLPEMPGRLDDSIPFVFDQDTVQLRRWIFRLDDHDPLDMTKARLEDFAQTAAHRSYSSVPTEPPFDGIYTWQLTTDEVTAVTSSGAYGNAMAQILMYNQKVVVAGPTMLERTYSLDDHRFMYRFIQTQSLYGAQFQYKSWTADLQRVNFVGGQDPDYWRDSTTPCPAPLPTVNTGNEVIETWLIGNPTTKALDKVCMGKWELVDRGLGPQWERMGTYSIDVGASTDVAAPALEPLSAFPSRETKYEKWEIGAQPSGATFMIGANGYVYNRFGLPVTPTAVTPGTPINDTHLLRIDPTTKTMQLMMPDSRLVGSVFNLTTTPGVKDDPDLADVLGSASVWNPVTNTRFLLARPSSGAPGRYTEGVSVEIIYDSLDGIDHAASWPR